MLFGALLAGCASTPSEPSGPASPQPSNTYQLVDELCAALDPQPLIDLDGGTTATREWPPRPDRPSRKCTLSVSQRDPVAGHVLTVTALLAESPELAREAVPRQPKPQSLGTWYELPQLGDGAWVWIMPVEKGMEVPDVDAPVAFRRAMVHVARGDAYVMLDLTSMGAKVPDDADTEALLVAYTEETLTLMTA
ncbi:hypothetical protein E0H26_18695 [Micromonospora zingiberis]|uniref:DUF3558 domain-containing protein n=1 Tax=Micromonospora zingiberis TaxID=2053011 RepID=A0A4R0GGQ9_9ACTN|nr:hypothetical protein [Micromonospora zingiberis]TCB95827.1 hypothetical protein E0H26_18695 [Micromonospora zingiberis]